MAGIVLGVVLVVGGITAIVVTRSSDEKPAPGLEGVAEANSAKVGQVAPDFALETLDGGTVRLSEFRGRPVVLNFWASWCTPCREEFPMFRDTLGAEDGASRCSGVDTGDLRGDARRSLADDSARTGRTGSTRETTSLAATASTRSRRPSSSAPTERSRHT